MPNIISVTYGQTSQSTKIYQMGMRDMQARSYEFRDAYYFLLKGLPASGKSCTLMLIALDKYFLKLLPAQVR